MNFISPAIAGVKAPRVACLMMQRDEEALLTPWIKYHATLFGMANLFVFDNGSASERVIGELTDFSGLGVNVVWDYKLPEHYHRKGDLIGALIASLAADYDFFIPLDCDEFLVLKTDRSAITCEPRAVMEALGPLLAVQDTLRINEAFFNVLGYPDWFWCWPQQKSFFAKGFSYLDHGFHNGRTESGNTRLTGFAHVHYHHKPYRMMVQHAKNKLAPYVDVEDRDALSTYRGTNYHCARPILQDFDTYMGRFGTKGASFLPAFPNFLRGIGVPVPFERTAAA